MTIEIKKIDYFDEHWYRLETENGIIFIPSVTTKLGITNKPFLARWRGDIGNREADMRLFEAQMRGSRIHECFEILCNGGTIVYNPSRYPTYTTEEIAALRQSHAILGISTYQDEYLDILKLTEFMKIVKPEILACEMTVYSLENNDAGTLDGLYRIKGGKYLVNGSKPLDIQEGVYVVDLKTGSMVDKNAYRQTAAYAACVKEMGIADPIGTIILHTQSKNRGGIEGLGVHLRNIEQMNADYLSYRIVSSLWDDENKESAPRNFQFPSMISLVKGVKI